MKKYNLNVKIVVSGDDIPPLDIYYNLIFFADNGIQARKKAIEIIRKNMELQNNPIYQQLNNIVGSQKVNKPKNVNNCKKRTS